MSLLEDKFEEGNKYDLLLADLGYNSWQLENRDGFSWRIESELDMRYSGDPEIRKCSDLVLGF